jgi:proteic killer suppression protein
LRAYLLSILADYALTPDYALSFDIYKQFVYNIFVIRSFACKETERLFQGIKSRKLPQDIQARAAVKLAQLDAAVTVEDLRLPPSNRLEALSGKRYCQWSIRINDQWRVCFKFDTDGAHEVDITDYH